MQVATLWRESQRRKKSKHAKGMLVACFAGAEIEGASLPEKSSRAKNLQDASPAALGIAFLQVLGSDLMVILPLSQSSV